MFFLESLIHVIVIGERKCGPHFTGQESPDVLHKIDDGQVCLALQRYPSHFIEMILGKEGSISP